MSLATRCTACGTIFRIVEDQLRVSDGWVRCGRCAEIFDARELLFDIEQQTPPPWPAPFTAAQVAETPPPVPAPQPAAEPVEPAWSPAEAGAAPSEAGPTEWSPTESSRREPRWVEDADPRPSEPAPAATAWPPDSAPAMSAEPEIAAAAPMPEFMRRAENSARWKRPGVRLAMAVAAALLALLLVLQAVLHFRDALAAAHPPARGGLQALCGVFGCEVRPWADRVTQPRVDIAESGGKQWWLQAEPLLAQQIWRRRCATMGGVEPDRRRWRTIRAPRRGPRGPDPPFDAHRRRIRALAIVQLQHGRPARQRLQRQHLLPLTPDPTRRSPGCW